MPLPILLPILLGAIAPPAATQPAAGATIRLDEGAIAYRPAGLGKEPAPLLVLLHGLGGGPDEMIDRFRAEADRRGVVLVAPKSLGPTWDLLADRSPNALAAGRARLGDDPPRITRALRAVATRLPIDQHQIALGGFSDGASYAITVGTSAPGLFRTLLIFSPGVDQVTPGDHAGQRAFVAHGDRDRVLSFERTRTRFVPTLEKAGVAVTFAPFAGDHQLDSAIMTRAFDFWLDAAGATIPGGKH